MQCYVSESYEESGSGSNRGETQGVSLQREKIGGPKSAAVCVSMSALR